MLDLSSLVARALLVVGALSLAEPVCLAGPEAESVAPSPSLARKIVRGAYDRFERFAEASGATISFALDDFRDIPKVEFHESSWIEQVSMPAVPMIDIHRSTHTWQIEGEDPVRRVQYIPSWNDTAPAYLDTAEGNRLRSLTVEAVLEQVGREQPQYRQIEALTSYRVVVTFEGRQRTYRALVLWKADDRPGRFGTFFIDHITQGLDLAAVEEIEPMEAERREALEAPSRVRSIVVND